MSDNLGDALDQTARETVRVPANIMALLRQSYDTREKILDWMLAIGVTVVLAYALRDDIRAMFGRDPSDPNAGKADEPQANQDIGSAFPGAGPSGGRWPGLYAYNMPMSRNIRASVGPGSTRPPDNPSAAPVFQGSTQ